MTTSNDYPARQITRARRLSRSFHDIGVILNPVVILQALALVGLVLDAEDDLTSGGVAEAIRRMNGDREAES